MGIQWEHLRAAIVLTILGLIGGFLVASEDQLLRATGVAILLVDVYVEYYYLSAMDTRGEVARTSADLATLVNEARELRMDLKETAKQLREFDKKTFDVFSKKGFMNVEQRLKAIEDQLEGRGEFSSFKNLNRDVESLKRQLGWRF